MSGTAPIGWGPAVAGPAVAGLADQANPPGFAHPALGKSTPVGKPASGDEAVLAVSGLSKRFGARRAVQDATFSVFDGQIHGLLGPNGAGKTTTLQMLLGTVRPDAGSIEFKGRALAADLPRGRAGIAGFVGTPGFYPYLTASRNLELLSAWDGPRASSRVEELLDMVGLADRAQSKVRTFSTGMRQRLALAAALISEPEVLIVDEPATGLDPAGIRQLHSQLTALAAAGAAVVLSSHDLDEVEQLCSSVTVLREGRVVYDGTVAALEQQAPIRQWRLHTSDDDVAAHLAGQYPVQLVAEEFGHLLLKGGIRDLDAFVLALGTEGIAVRGLVRNQMPLESLFFELTGPVGTR